MKCMKQQGLAVFVSSCLALGIAHNAAADQSDLSMVPPTQAAQRTPEQLQQLVAPIALYPDALVAQILAASSYTVQIVEADRWMQAHSELTGDALAVEVNKQNWDPSVQALTEFPSVLANMDQNLAWTSSLGDAYLSQPQDLMAAVQALRQQAQAAGNLQSNSQETVTNDGDAIAIEPAVSDLVYVPEYDPWLIYGAPIAVWPGWYPYSGLYFDGPGIVFGVAFGLGYYGGYRWGWHHWHSDWHHRDVMYNHAAYVSHASGGIGRDNFFYGHQYSDRAVGLNQDHGFAGGPGFHALQEPLRSFAQVHTGFVNGPGRIGGFGNVGVGRGFAAAGRPGFGGMAHAGGGFHGGGGGGHGGGGAR
jgi:hypothetical protein